MAIDERLLDRHSRLPEPQLGLTNTALLVIDMQYGDAHREYGNLKRIRDQGQGDVVEYYISRVERVVIPNVQRLLRECRQVGVEVIHTRIESLTKDGRDRSLEHKNLGIHHPPGSVEAQFLDPVAPLGDEITLTKTCGGVFNGTNIEYILRNLGVQNLIIAGVVTSGCVEVAVRDASDRGFSVILVDDACATWSSQMQDAAVRAMRGIYAVVWSTDEVCDVVRKVGVQKG